MLDVWWYMGISVSSKVCLVFRVSSGTAKVIQRNSVLNPSHPPPPKKAGLNLKALWGSKGSLSEGKKRRKLEVLSVYRLSSGSASLLSDWNTEQTLTSKSWFLL